jgi:hypothetical protein
VASFLALLVPSTAHAYCWAATCKDGGTTLCDDEPVRDGCAPLRWKSACVGFSVQRDGSQKLTAPEVDDLVRTAFSSWAAADCGGASPGFVVQDLGEVACDKVEYNSDAGNANIIVFRETSWPHPHTEGHDIALTTTTYDPDTGELLDADMEINAANFDLTTGDLMVDFDLLSVLTHETGHFMGLAHSFDPTATMRPSYEPGNVELRQITPDDTTAICSLYAPDPSLDDTCNPLPRHGFSPECKGSQTEGKCSVSLGATDAAAPPFAVALALTGLLALRARSARRRR